MLRILLVRPGATDFEEQRRIRGTLDIPLNEQGAHQVARTVDELAEWEISAIYSSPEQCAEQTAAALADSHRLNFKTLDMLRNIDHGLWHGKLIDEVRQNQPRVYRQFQDHPETICPPQGESIESARHRVQGTLQKLFRKHRRGVIVLVVPEPLARIVHCVLLRRELGNLWDAECDCGRWDAIDVEPERVALTA